MTEHGNSSTPRRGVIALTGATGFLGSHIADCLLAGGWAVRTAVRATSDRRWLTGKPLEVVETDLHDSASCAALLAGTCGLIHCAGVVASKDAAAYRRGNVETTRVLLAAAARTWTEPVTDPPPVFLLVSSLAARGPAPLAAPARETDPSAPVSEYGRSKREAEQLVSTAPGLFRRVVLRPPALYGPRDREFLPMFRLARAGWALALGNRLSGMSLVDGRDAAAAAVALVETPTAEGVFFVDDGARGYDFAGVARALTEATGRRVRLVPLPLGVVRGAARLLRLLGPGVSTALAPNRIDDLAQVGWVCDGSRLEQVTGYRCARRAAQGFQETIAFNRELGWQ